MLWSLNYQLDISPRYHFLRSKYFEGKHYFLGVKRLIDDLEYIDLYEGNVIKKKNFKI